MEKEIQILQALESRQDYSGSSGAAVIKWIYNPTNGTLARKEYADGKGLDFTDTPGGKIKTRTWERGITTIYNYDDIGQLQTTEYTDDTETASYTYDRMGRVKTVSNGVVDYTYDSAGRFSTITSSVSSVSSGARSAAAMQSLESAGYTHVVNGGGLRAHAEGNR